MPLLTGSRGGEVDQVQCQVWAVMPNEVAVQKVRDTVQHVDFSPKRLVMDAYDLGSDDNITALVVYFKIQ